MLTTSARPRSRRPRLLMLTRYPSSAASSRIRLLAFEHLLEGAGYTVKANSFFSEGYIRARYAGSGRPRLFALSLLCLIRRLSLLLVMAVRRKYDIIWVQSEALPYMPFFLERLVSLAGRRIVFDFDDAIHYRFQESRILQAVSGDKFRKMAAVNRQCVATVGNAYLHAWASNTGYASVHLVPSLVDRESVASGEVQEKRAESLRSASGTEAIVGWLGSPTTAPYLEPILEAIGKSCSKPNFRLLICGAAEDFIQRYQTLEPIVAFLPWSLESENDFLDSLDLGVMPLHASEWERGKCGYKLVRYMARGVPFLATDTEANRAIAAHGGGACLSERASGDEWLQAICDLLDDRDKRLAFSENGRRAVESHYTYSAQFPSLLAVLSGDGNVVQ